jgi:protein-tyrosine phosphatase
MRPPRVQTVLFLCSANYYRSRFAEHLFNALAEAEKLPWRAESRGLMVGYWGNIGPISRYTIAALAERGMAIGGAPREPQQLSAADLARVDLVVAVKEAEHRPAMAELFPDWADGVEYWHVHDLDCAGPESALPELEEHVRALVSRLSTAAADAA